MCPERPRAFKCRDLFTIFFFFFSLDLVMPSQSILKGVQDLNICVKVAKKNNIDYKLFSVTKDELTPFLTKRLE